MNSRRMARGGFKESMAKRIHGTSGASAYFKQARLDAHAASWRRLQTPRANTTFHAAHYTRGFLAGQWPDECMQAEFCRIGYYFAATYQQASLFTLASRPRRTQPAVYLVSSIAKNTAAKIIFIFFTTIAEAYRACAPP